MITFLLFICPCIIGTIFTRIVLPSIENRKDVDFNVIDDPILRFIPCYECSDRIFLLLYTNIILLFLDFWFNYELFKIYTCVLQYSCVLVLKSLCMYICPLDYPENYTPLVDPILRLVCATDHHSYGRDLMFSGHQAVCFICYFNCSNRILWISLSLPLMA